MNSAIRRLSVIVLVMFLALMGSSTWVQFFDANSLNGDPRNRHTLYREYGTFRGPIVVDGQAIASSSAVNDPFGYQRAYSDGWLYAPVTGFYSVVYGRTGIEQAENTLLNGSDDSLFWTRLGDLLAGKEQSGATVELTLRSELQRVAADSLGAQRGAVVALDPRTGEILAMVTSPSYDPGRLASHTTADVVSAYRELEDDPAQPLINRAIAGDTYAPGSLFKLITTTAALESGYTADTPLYAPRELTLPLTTATITNFGNETCGPDDRPTLAYALQHSCNTPFAGLAMSLGWDSIARKAQEFGWGDSLSIPLTVTPSRLPENPDAAQTAMSGIGQYDVRATPLQMAMVGSAIANGGVLMRPYLVADTRDSSLQTLSVARPETYSTPMGAETASALRAMMIAVVEGGTGTAAQITGIAVAGKTGTAESGTDAAPHAWFLGFAPADNPVVVVVVMVENGGNAGSEATGGMVAAPIAKAVIQKAIELDQLRKDQGLPMIAEGVLLGGRYRLGRVLAIGGMGQVWRGHDEELGTHVAIKVLKDEATTNAVFLKRFEIEARNAAGLGHRNIAQVLDYGTFEGNAFMIMELVEGESLAAILERERVLEARRLVRILIDACHGLQAAHDAGVIHRDVKPGNLLVQPDGTVKITDFGVSRSADQTALTQTGMVMGTAQYLAPELALGKPATPRSDLYALGIIAYEALVGRRPFTAANPVDIAIAQVNDPVPPLPDTIPPALTAVIMDLLEKSPKRRPESAKSLARELAALRLPTEAEQRFRSRPIPESIRPRHKGGAPSRPMPPSIAPRKPRPRPDAPRGD